MAKKMEEQEERRKERRRKIKKKKEIEGRERESSWGKKRERFIYLSWVGPIY